MLRHLLVVLIASVAITAEPLALAAVPPGRLQAQLMRLQPGARAQALQTLGQHPGLLRDAHHLDVSPGGGLVVSNCASSSAPAVRRASAAVPLAADIAIADLPAFNSLPASPRTLVLDFTGATITGTQWNDPGNTQYTAFPTYTARPFDLDGDETTFNDQEQEHIRLICERVAEDFRPFDINITTVEPTSYGPNIGHALITNSIDGDGNACPYQASGGVAYFNTFGRVDYEHYSPAWVYHNRLSNDEHIIADVVSHEFGHNLGLEHDGKPGVEYYTGHGSPLSWGAIMGAAYTTTITQWSRGEYAGANNTEDDLGIIAGKLTRRTDDHGDLPETATASAFIAGPGGSRDLAAGQDGVIASRNDIDLFRFTAEAGPVTLTITPFAVTSTPAVSTPGTNLDVRADILDESGVVVAGLSSDPVDDPVASISGTLPQAGVYHLRVRGAGNRDARTTGFSTYASIGSYTLTGNVPAAIPGTISFSTASLSQNEGSTTRTLLLTVQRSIDATGGTSVDYATSDLTGVAGTDYEAASGSLVWLDGDPVQQTIPITVHGDAIDEAGRSFLVTLSSPTNANVLGLAPVVTVTLRNDDGAVPGSGDSDDDGGGGGGGGGGCSAGAAASLLLACFGLVARRRRSPAATR